LRLGNPAISDLFSLMGRKERVPIGVFDDQPATTAGIAAFFETEGEIKVVWSAETVEELDRMAAECPPTVIVVDFKICGEDEDQTILSWMEAHSDHRIVVYSGFYLERNVRDAFKCVAMAWVRKSDALDDLAAAIRNAAVGKKTIRATDEAFFRMDRVLDLSEREREVLHLLYQGLANEDIAAGLDMSITTVKTHISHIFCKLDASSRSEAVHRAIERGILSVPTEVEQDSKRPPG
jgi:DNA-binding NarL/FixJ family response regulator